MEFIVYHDGKIIDSVRADRKEAAQKVADEQFAEPVEVVHWAAERADFTRAERRSIERLAEFRQQHEGIETDE